MLVLLYIVEIHQIAIMQVVLYIARALQITAVSVFVLWVMPSLYLLIRDEIIDTFTNIREMREDNRANKRRMAQLVRDAQIRWEMKMGVKTDG